jgi:nicotinamide-nucleotide amidase
MSSLLLWSEEWQDLIAACSQRAQQRGERLAVAESCTGGMIGSYLTGLPGISVVFAGSIVAYDNSLKTKLLGVDPLLLEQHGAVSGPVATEMAKGARRVMGVKVGLAATGIAGPDGGSDEKPVGTVYLGMCDAEGIAQAKQQFFEGDRQQIRQASTRALLRWYLSHKG